MSIRIANIAVDAADAAELAGFWAAVLQRPVDAGANEFFASIGYAEDNRMTPSMMFLKVPEERSGKNRVHLDLEAPDYARELERLTTLGATVLGEHSEMGITWTTLTDPEGNVFDVAAGH